MLTFTISLVSSRANSYHFTKCHKPSYSKLPIEKYFSILGCTYKIPLRSIGPWILYFSVQLNLLTLLYQILSNYTFFDSLREKLEEELKLPVHQTNPKFEIKFNSALLCLKSGHFERTKIELKLFIPSSWKNNNRKW